MTIQERLIADYGSTGLTVGHHPLFYRRSELHQLGVKSAVELNRIPNGQKVRAAGCVIARQRPGTAHGFIFISMEDETGIANVIITPDLYANSMMVVLHERFVFIEGILQNKKNVVHIKAEGHTPLRDMLPNARISIQSEPVIPSHDFH